MSEHDHTGWNSTRFWAALAVASGAMAGFAYYVAVTDGLKGFSGTLMGVAGLVQLGVCMLSSHIVTRRTARRMMS